MELQLLGPDPHSWVSANKRLGSGLPPKCYMPEANAKRMTKAWLIAFGIAVAASPAWAWVYPEHRDIAVLSVVALDPERRALFEQMWSEARTGSEGRLCANSADVT